MAEPVPIIPYCLFGPSGSGTFSVASTPASTDRYADAVDLMYRFDARTIGQCCTDDGQELSREAIISNENCLMALNDSSGRVEAALRHGNRYTLVNLTEELTANSLNHLKSIVCTIAMVRLLRRRPGCYTDLLQQLQAEAEDHLKQLSSGYDVFSIDSHVAAGEISDSGNSNAENANLLQQRNLISDNMIGRAFPHRGPGGLRNRGGRFNGG